MLNDFQPKTSEKYALIFGNEVNGVSDEAMKLIDTCIEIPQFGTKHSFNIVVSAGIVLWDFFAKLKLKS
jgi:tRNA G18 (ribose-2'-O)-methylase SpoU